MLSGGHTPPSVMPIDSPHEPPSGGNDNSPGGALPQGLLATVSVWRHHLRATLQAHHSRMLLNACLFATPARESHHHHHPSQSADGAGFLVSLWVVSHHTSSPWAHVSRGRVPQRRHHAAGRGIGVIEGWRYYPMLGSAPLSAFFCAPVVDSSCLSFAQPRRCASGSGRASSGGSRGTHPLRD